MVKNLPATCKTWVRSLGQEDPLRREWLPTPAILPIESHEQKSLVGSNPWNCKELDRTEWLTLSRITIQPWTRCQCPHGWFAKFICNPEINTLSALLVIYGHVQSRKYLSHPTNSFSCWGLMRCDFFAFWVQLLYYKQGPFALCLVVCFFAFLCSLLVILLFEIAHNMVF